MYYLYAWSFYIGSYYIGAVKQNPLTPSRFIISIVSIRI